MVMSEREMATATEIPVACLLDEADLARREEEIATEIFTGVRSIEELADGYAFEFPADMAVADRIVEFVAVERRCCPFFTFELVFQPDNGPIWLRLRGPDGAKAVIEEMLPNKRNSALSEERT
jgi:hypothetical protein